MDSGGAFRNGPKPEQVVIFERRDAVELSNIVNDWLQDRGAMVDIIHRGFSSAGTRSTTYMQVVIWYREKE